MTNSKTTKKAFLSSVTALILCFAMLLGTTFAWFTDSEVSGRNTIKSGNLDVVLEYKTSADGTWAPVTEDTKLFNENALYEPGYTEVVFLRISNAGSLSLKYNLNVNIFGETTSTNVNDETFSLKDYLEIGYYAMDESLGQYLLSPMFGTREQAIANINSVNGSGFTKLSEYDGIVCKDAPLPEDDTFTPLLVTLVLTMPETVGNEANHKTGVAAPTIDLGVSLVATQYTDESDSFNNQYDKESTYPEIFLPVWNGTADTSWYNDTDTTFYISTAEQLAGLNELVDAGDNFAGKTVKLTKDIDLGAKNANGDPVSFDPIGDKSAFSGTFDGDGHTISNLYQSGWDFGYQWGSYGSLGLFGEIENATIKNVVISGANAQVEGGDIAGITGSASGTCVFENITVENSTFGTYNNGIGGIIGWSGAGEYTFKNINIGSDVVLGGLWGSFDSSIGGVVGQGEPGATYNFENVNVACRLDAYNDVTASYQYYLYRMTGMLIGRLAKTTTIEGSNYPDMSQYNINCTNVTVTYGDWMNYHYCYGFNGSRYTRVEAGYTYGGLDVTADDHSTTCTDHMLLLPFEGLFGGDQYGVKPIKEYTGVTVVLPANN